MPKHESFYVFKITDSEKRIVGGLNEKESRRNLSLECPEFDCPKAKLLSVHETFLKALEWRANDNKENS